MASLRPPSTSRSPSPGAGNGTLKSSSRASMGPSGRPAPISPINPPISPRPGSGRPTSELLSGGGMFQTPEADAIDQWFENLQNYEATLEEMAAASLDVNFKEELSAIEQWFRVLSEAERTAALYSLLQHSTQVQIRFFITVLQQMARSDPMTALLSPNAGGSMQNQMEAKLAQMGLKSPGIKPPVPASPSARTFSGAAAANRQSLALDAPASSFLSPDSAGIQGTNDAAATLAQQRAKLKANAAHRISAPALASVVVDGPGGGGGNAARGVWAAGGALSQVAERGADSPVQELTVPAPAAARPKSTDFSGLAGAFRSPRLAAGDDEHAALQQQLSPMVGGNWASMVNTPLVPMFDAAPPGAATQGLDAAAAKLANWQMGPGPGLGGDAGGRFSLDDARKYRRAPKGDAGAQGSNAVYGDDGNLLSPGGHAVQRGAPGMRGANGVGVGNGGFFGGAAQGWPGVQGARSPALSGVSSRFGSDDGGMGGLGGFGMGVPSPGLGMAGLAGMGGLNPLHMGMLGMNMNLGAMGLTPEAQLLAAQMAAGGFMQPGLGAFGMGAPQSAGRSARGAARPPGKANSAREGGAKEKDEEVDPTLLGDVPAWLRSLRLHKYTPNFEGMSWKDMVVMDEAALEANGVAALGARRKMLKTFEAVRNKMGIEAPA